MNSEPSLYRIHKKAVATVKKLPVLIRREVASARLPFNYLAAQQAVSECARIDEAKEWANKAEAIASYARQIKDFTMGDNAKRIVLRATRRMGELLLEIESNYLNGKASHRDYTDAYGEAETIPNIPKTVYERTSSQKGQVTAAARRTNVAKDIARLPSSKFEYHVSATPIKTPHQVLVAEGERASRPRDSSRTIFVSSIDKLFLLTTKAQDVPLARDIKSDGTKELKNRIRIVRDWLDRIDQIVNS